MNNKTSKFLNIGCWNINGLKDKYKDNSFLQCVDKFDIICLQETKIAVDMSVHINNFHVIKISRPHEKNFPISGGMMILIKPSVLEGINVLPNNSSEIQWLQLKRNYFSFEKDVFLCFTYISPQFSSYTIRHNLDILSDLEKDIVLYSETGNIMICGDTNARIGKEIEFIDNDNDYVSVPSYVSCNCYVKQKMSEDRVCNSRGRELLDICTSSNLVVLNGRTCGDQGGKYTCFQYNGNSVVDYCIVSELLFNNILYFHVQDHYPLLSDHSLISVRIRGRFSYTMSNNTSTMSDIPIEYIWNEMSRYRYINALSSNEIHTKINQFMLEPLENADDALSQFNDIVYKACNISLKKKVLTKHKKKVKQKKKWFDNDLNHMRKQLISKSNLYSKYPNDPLIRGSFYRFRKSYNKLCKQKRKTFKRCIIEKLDNLHNTDPSEYWKLVKELKDDENNDNDPSDKIAPDKWIDHFTSLFSVKQEFKRQNEIYTDLQREAEINKTFCELDFKITTKEVSAAISKLKNKKSCGLDGIKNEMLKSGQTYLIPCIVKLFNSFLSKGVYPKKWKTGYIKPIYKAEDPLQPSNYRGITIMSCVSKLFNSILNERLQSYLDRNKIIDHAQIGFQPKARTSDHMFVLRTIIEKYQSKGLKVYACFVDFAKAFDSVLHSVMFYKLCSLGISGNFYNVVKNMYDDNHLHIKLQSKLTKTFVQNVGVRQGDNLSPNLFKLYINDLASCFDTDDDQIILDQMSLSCLMYADDLVLLSTSATGLQKCIRKLETYSDSYGLNVNLKKTNIIVFSKSGKMSDETFKYKDIEIKHVNTYKYLGIIFSASGTFSFCQEDLYKRALKAHFKLRKSFEDLHDNVDTILHIFDHTIKPILLYSSEIWGTINSASASAKKDGYDIFKALESSFCEKLHKKFLKYVLGVHKKATNDAVMGELGRYPIYIDMLCSTLKYLQHLLHDDVSNLLKCALNESNCLRYQNKKSWISDVDFLLMKLGVPTNCMNSRNISQMVKNKLVIEYKKQWASRLHNSAAEGTGKLRTYSLFKTELCKEKYLHNVKDKKVRKCLTNFRISSHKLEIEVGRYKKIDADVRFCQLCKEGFVEDELHFMLECKCYEIERKVFIQHVIKVCAKYTELDKKQQLIWLLSNESNCIINIVANFIFKCYSVRLERLRSS